MASSAVLDGGGRVAQLGSGCSKAWARRGASAAAWPSLALAAAGWPGRYAGGGAPALAPVAAGRARVRDRRCCSPCPREPPLWAGWLAAGAGLACALLAARSWRGAPSVGRGAAAGCRGRLPGLRAWPKLRLNTVAAPILARAGVYAVEGRVVDLAPLPSGERVLLDRVTLDGVAPEATPATIRVNLRRAPAGLTPGDRIRVRARLQRPMGPALPGGVRFRAAGLVRAAGCGGLLHGRGRAAAAAMPAASRWPWRSCAPAIAQRITAENPGPAGAMAAALVGGRARRHRPGDLARHAGLGPGPHPLGVGPAHGDGGRQRLRRSAAGCWP